MNYQEFLNTIEIEMKQRLDPCCQLRIQSFTRNNGTCYDGLIIFSPTVNISPTIYLNPYYHRYLDGVPLEDIYQDIITTYKTHLPTKDFDIHMFTDYNRARHSIIMKLIHYERNRVLLETVPHFRYLDFAVTFHCYVSKCQSGYASILIHNHHLNLWNISTEELRECALQNTPRLLPYELENMVHVLKNYFHSQDQTIDPCELPMYILTNSSKLNGASVILYEGLLHNIAQRFEKDLILLPSSIHEFLIIPADSDQQISYFNDMINEVNHTQLSDDEILSDHAYYYSLQKKQLYIPDAAGGR